jgi:peptide/nickel transport system permease protein
MPYIFRRLIQVPFVLLVVSLGIFAITRAVPGDPVQIMLGLDTSPEAVTSIRKEFNLDRPIPVQYVLWIENLARGDLGRSIRLNQPVTQLIAERLPISLELAAMGMVFALLLALPLGIAAALKRGTWIDHLCSNFTVWGYAFPNFALALVLIYVFSLKLGWLPITGIGSRAVSDGGFWATFSPFIVPAVALCIHPASVLARLLRTSMIEVLEQDYIRTARAKGLAPFTIIMTHALKNAAIPFVTMAAIQSAHLIGSQVTIEYIFAIPGLGSAVLNAVVNRDFPVLQGVILVIAIFFLAANLIADIAYAFLDPRIKL